MPKDEATANNFPSGDSAICSIVPLPQRAKKVTFCALSAVMGPDGGAIAVPMPTGRIGVGDGVTLGVAVFVGIEVAVGGRLGVAEGRGDKVAEGIVVKVDVTNNGAGEAAGSVG